MNARAILAQQGTLLWRFLGFFQQPFVRMIHAAVAILVMVQLLDSLDISIKSNGDIGPGTVAWVLSWAHILIGISALLLACVLAWTSLTGKGLRHFFPYLWGDVEQLQADIKASLRLEMVGPRPKGLAAAVQGLGLGALLLTVLSGGFWLLFLLAGEPDLAVLARTTHKNVSTLLLIYLLGHGGMALLHFASWQRKVIWKNNA